MSASTEFTPYYEHGKYTSALITTMNIDAACREQILSLLNNPNYRNPVAIMPDTHAGKGAIIGFTMKLGDSINPATVGVDQGCGMLSCKFETAQPFDRQLLDKKIREVIPFGENVADELNVSMEKEFPWKAASEIARKFTMLYNREHGTAFQPAVFDYTYFSKKCREIGADQRRAEKSIGSVGGGNHFIEFSCDDQNARWVTIHSGSRNFGSKLCQHWERIMQGELTKAELREKVDAFTKEAKKTLKGTEISAAISKFKETLQRRPTAFLQGKEMFGYLMDLILGQQYASFNRQVILENILKILEAKRLDTIETVHNYVDFEDLIIRKGAIKGYIGERVVIPFNMEEGILICEGKSQADWNCSLPHGAGRIASRRWANENLDPESARKEMEFKDIYSSVIPADEIKAAYKPAAEIEAYISANATIVGRLRPTLNLKAPSEKFGEKKKVKLQPQLDAASLELVSKATKSKGFVKR